MGAAAGLDYADLLGSSGAFAQQVPGFVARDTQQTLAAAIGAALEQQSVLVAEAGTGIGKTFAYLVPALLSGKRVLISTGTRALQDQIYHRDLPAVANVLGRPVKVALLKGRANYLCRYRLGQARAAPGWFDGERASELAAVAAWAGITQTGDRAELGSVPENSSVWSQVTSTPENCLGQKCLDYARCFVFEARRRAQEADVVVINHHLLLADMVLKDQGFGALLPGADMVIADEAHQLPEIAARYFSVSLSTRQLSDWLGDTRREYRQAGLQAREFEQRLDALDAAIADLQRSPERSTDPAWQELDAQPQLRAGLGELQVALQALTGDLVQFEAQSAGLGNSRERAEALSLRLKEFLDDAPEESSVRWIESQGRGLSLNLTPLDTAAHFQAAMQSLHCGWVFLSATLSVHGSFQHFRERLGLVDAEELLLGSPFDYAHNALLYLPAGLPDVASAGYTDAVVAAAEPVVAASGGRAFLLFTSHRALATAAALLRGRSPFPLLVQGEAPRRRLLERFRALGNAVLLGTASFWEGVDVKGPALSVVVIDKLPFASPGDPLVKARLAAYEREGRQPFIDYQLPQAVLALKQGVGRLIRDESDTGVLMLCDPRLSTRGYGKLFLDSLPPMQHTRELDEVRTFLGKMLPEPMRRMQS
ncbi:MAG: ATP-dependent DNA helicase [Gammaproteobacteria bacterium]